MDLGLAGRTALVTGSYRGTGAGIAAVLAAEGAHVVIHGFEPGQPDATVHAITEAGGSAEGAVADIATDDGVAALADVAAAVDICVANYGSPVGSSWSSMDDWAAEWNTNVLTGVRVAQLCLPGMRDRGWGRVVVLGTLGSRKPGTHSPGYYAAKSGLHTLVRTLAMELRGTGVTANLVSPGMIATSEVRDMLTRRAAKRGVDGGWAEVERWGLDHAMPNLTDRLPDPEDIGKVVAFIASDAAWHLNGADIAVDGGALDA